ncbi:hypothetical protein Bca52824_016154 [Brassica carinata]|uniref:Uncharacterized protein n=1 Tax=Brassica carinata TaxID=52824 RepID=A0A8X7W3F8_BRACI|nr:hypothetical protein Bca52824_016154 [Brassica carinata]
MSTTGTKNSNNNPLNGSDQTNLDGVQINPQLEAQENSIAQSAGYRRMASLTTLGESRSNPSEATSSDQ